MIFFGLMEKTIITDCKCNIPCRKTLYLAHARVHALPKAAKGQEIAIEGFLAKERVLLVAINDAHVLRQQSLAETRYIIFLNAFIKYWYE